ncbi:NAD-binding protein [bacterium]|nr:NAD-binding protein [bacterium]
MAKIGFIGLGTMGAFMAGNILQNGYDLCVFNRTAEKMEPLIRQGAEGCSTPAEVGEKSAIVVLCVSDAPDVNEIIMGEKGVASGMKDGGIIIDCSTSSPELAQDMAKQLVNRGIGVLDAPISGGPEGAKNGKLAIMVGGEEPDFDKALPILQAMGEKITLVGPPGAGQLTKAVNQILVGTNLAAVAEGIALARKSNIDPNKVMEAISEGAAKSWALSMRGPLMLREEFTPPKFTVALHAKDFRLAMETAQNHGCQLEIAEKIHSIFQKMVEEGEGELDNSGIYKYIKKINNL